MNLKFIRYPLGFILFIIILASFYYSKIILFITSVFFIIIAMNEYRNMFKVKEIYPHKILPELTGILCAYIFTFYNNINFHYFITPILLMGIILTFALTVIKNKKPYLMTSFTTIAGFLLIFCGLYIIKLTYFFEENHSWYLILIYFFAVLSGDYSASIVGPKFKNKIYIAPEISPNKTLAGCISNLISTCLICLLLTKFLELNILSCLGLGITISIFSQFGDLTISTFKRDLGIKHSGNLFLEYGGILDRMDAFIFSAPAAYYYLFIISQISNKFI